MALSGRGLNWRRIVPAHVLHRRPSNHTRQYDDDDGEPKHHPGKGPLAPISDLLSVVFGSKPGGECEPIMAVNEVLDGELFQFRPRSLTLRLYEVFQRFSLPFSIQAIGGASGMGMDSGKLIGG